MSFLMTNGLKMMAVDIFTANSISMFFLIKAFLFNNLFGVIGKEVWNIFDKDSKIWLWNLWNIYEFVNLIHPFSIEEKEYDRKNDSYQV